MTKEQMIEKLEAANVPLTGKEKSKDLKELLKTLPVDLQEGEYHLTVTFNGETFDFYTDDIFVSFRSIPVPFLKSRVVITVTTKEGKKAERILIGTMARNLFRNDTALKILIKRLILK